MNKITKADYEFFQHYEEDEGFKERYRGQIIFYAALTLFIFLGVVPWMIGVYHIIF